jgi:hypothetical protein
MRFTRKRFTPSSTRDTSSRRRAILTRAGISRFSQSQLGMSVRREAIMNQYQLQGSKCAQCLDCLDLADAVFLTTRFDSGSMPPVVHRRCRKKYEREQAKENENAKADI